MYPTQTQSRAGRIRKPTTVYTPLIAASTNHREKENFAVPAKRTKIAETNDTNRLPATLVLRPDLPSASTTVAFSQPHGLSTKRLNNDAYTRIPFLPYRDRGRGRILHSRGGGRSRRYDPLRDNSNYFVRNDESDEDDYINQIGQTHLMQQQKQDEFYEEEDDENHLEEDLAQRETADDIVIEENAEEIDEGLIEQYPKITLNRGATAENQQKTSNEEQFKLLRQSIDNVSIKLTGNLETHMNNFDKKFH
ncbi:unnamed protein product, partial [Didymodactylos carnosus]